MSRTTRPSPTRGRRRAAGGFTLVEVLVALAVVAVSLAAIGSLMGSTVRGARSLDRRIALIETARAVMTELPDRALLPRSGNLSGEYGGHRWRVDFLPYATGSPVPESARWVPESVVIRVQSPGGAVLQLDTIRLVRRRDP